MAEFESDVSFVVGIERSGKDASKHAIIRVSVIAVNTLTWSEIDTFNAKIAFRLENADQEWLRENTTFTELEWSDAERPGDVANALTKWLDRQTTRKRTGRNGTEYGVWRFIGWSVSSDVYWLDKWLERLGVRFRAIESSAELSVRDRLKWYFVENPHLTAPTVLSLENASGYFHLKTELGWSWSDARNVAASSLEVVRKMFGA